MCIGSYLADVITKIVHRHPDSRIDDLLPRARIGRGAYPVSPLVLISPHEGQASTSSPGNSLSFGTVLTSFMGAWQDGQLSVGGPLGSGAIFEVGIGITIIDSSISVPMGYSFSMYPLSCPGIPLRLALSRQHKRPELLAPGSGIAGAGSDVICAETRRGTNSLWSRGVVHGARLHQFVTVWSV